jgi:hypothetical protein
VADLEQTPPDYRREDLGLRIRYAGHGVHIELLGAWPSADLREEGLRLSAGEVEEALSTGGEALRSSRLADSVDVAEKDVGRPDPEGRLRRYVLDIADRGLSAIAWERAFPDDALVMRRSHVPPRASGVPMTLPLRVLVLSDDGPEPIDTELSALVAGEGLAVFDRTSIDDLASWRIESGAPMADVLHLAWPVPGDVDVGSTANPRQPGTVGWLERHTATLQTRLVVAECRDQATAMSARIAAAALADRGGPAMLVTSSAGLAESVYLELLVDRPLDALAHAGLGSLVAGAGREDSLRITPVASRIAEAAHWLPDALIGQTARFSRHVLAPTTVFLNASDALEGSKLLAAANEQLLQITGHRRPREPAEEAKPDRPRRLEVGLDEGEGVTLGEPSTLSVAIGFSRHGITTDVLSTIPAELLLAGADDEGRWLEVAVVGLDFEVLGDSVQPLWLPRDGSTQPALFTVVPQYADEDGEARLRVCLYADNNLLQSQMLVATGEGWTTHVEYALDVNADRFEGEHPRGLSIVANHHDDDPVIVVKGPDLFDEHRVTTNADLPSLIARVRKTLETIADRKDVDEYAFANDNAGEEAQLENALKMIAQNGWELFYTLFPQPSWERLEQLLADDTSIHVAHLLLEKVVPWALVYDREYAPNETENADGEALEHVACTAALEDGWQADVRCGEHPRCVLHEEQLRKRREAGGPGVQANTVACPRHVWGFRHLIEIPPQASSPDAQAPPPARSRTTAAGNPHVVAGINAGLYLSKAHESGIQQAWSAAPVEATVETILARAKLVARWKAPDPEFDMLYLFCHADGGVESGIDPPRLRLTNPKNDTEEFIEPQELTGQRWPHHPLVILNGCRTAAFSPDALSQFIRAFIGTYGAAGVIGTEVAVWEQLAVEFGEEFGRAFLSGEAAAETVLSIRRRLLEKNNPLGLAYTLYGLIDLSLA